MKRKETFKVIDLFAGSGGLGEGFTSLGYKNESKHFNIALSIEKDPSAHSTLLLRSFYNKFTKDKVPLEYWQYIKGEITRDVLFQNYPTQANNALREARCLELGKTPRKYVKKIIRDSLQGADKWVLIGGPPCQAYSIVGRSRMQSTQKDFEKDERHFLYKEYLRVIADHNPPVFIMENVRGMLSAKHSGKNIIDNILKDLKNPYHAIYRTQSRQKYRLFSLVESYDPEICDPADFIVKSENFGIPQARHRVLILGLRADIDYTPEILTPSNEVTVGNVIGDLPKIRSSLSKGMDSLESWKDVLCSVTSEAWFLKGKKNGLAPVISVMESALEKIKRNNLNIRGETFAHKKFPKSHADWYRSGSEGIIINHSSKSHMESDLQRYFFASSFAFACGRTVFLNDLPKALLPKHKNVLSALKSDHFSDRFRVQVRNRVSTTITSHISKDGHYFIHYDPVQCRSLTVREAARLQTFPDNYVFEGSRSSQYQQVGNAVPPLLSMQIAEIVYDILKRVKF